jgi:hypothetical protein
MKKTEWIRCPVCGNKTRDRIREDTVLKNYPLYCPKCKQEALIDAYLCQTISYIYYQRARRTDAEPITPRIVLSWVIGLFYLGLKSGGLLVLHFLRLDDSVSNTFHDN